MSEEKYCLVTCEPLLEETYWNNKYKAHTTGWDLGAVSPPLKSYIDKLQNKAIAILIPGCGNAYEAEYLLEKGFTNVTLIDIAPKLVEHLKNKYVNNSNITVVLGDFFAHEGSYELILEQTFFCALPPLMRQKYVWKMHQLLADNGILAGLLFNREFESNPPFGGSKAEYELLFTDAFVINNIGLSLNSIISRTNTELFFEFQKNNCVKVLLYNLDGLACKSSKNKFISKFLEVQGVDQVSINADFSQLLVVTATEIDLKALQLIAFDFNFKMVNCLI